MEGELIDERGPLVPWCPGLLAQFPEKALSRLNSGKPNAFHRMERTSADRSGCADSAQSRRVDNAVGIATGDAPVGRGGHVSPDAIMDER